MTHGNMGKVRSPGPTRSPTVRDLAWAAGFYEGEGSANHGRQAQIQAYIAQVQKWPLDRLQAMFGGSVRWYEAKGAYRDHWRWYVTGARARGFLMTVFTFLSPEKRAQVIRALHPITIDPS